MLPKDLEELQAHEKPNISEEPGSAQHHLWAKKGEGSGLPVPKGQDSAHLTMSKSSPRPPLSAGAKGHGTPGAVSYPLALREGVCEGGLWWLFVGFDHVFCAEMVKASV